MKIAILNIYSGLVERGSEVFIDELAQKLGEEHEVDVYQTGYNQKNQNYNQILIKKIPFIKSQGYIYSFIVLWFTLKSLPFLLIKKYDWIIPVNGIWQAFIIRIIRFFTQSKILISGHAGVGRDDLLNMVLGNPNIFVALSPKAYEWAKTIFPPKKVRFIPNGVNLNIFKPSFKKNDLGLPLPVVLCVSALLPYKRIDLLIRAVSQTKASLFVIGDGSKKNEITKLGHQILGSRFELLPYVPHEKIVNYYQSCDLFSLPSESSEAFGLVYLEALACNVPLVVPNDENRIQLVGEAGLACNVENIQEYSSCLEKAFTTNFSTKPRLQAEKYSWNKVVAQYEALLKEF